MVSRLHWIPTRNAGRLAIAARPRAGDWLETEVDAWKSSGLDQVMSLLEADEVSELGLRDEAELCREKGIAFLAFPIPDRGVPDVRDARQIAVMTAREIAAGRSVAIHCRAGIGRSSLIAACVLICLGIDADDALRSIAEARGVSVPDTEEQREWIVAFGRAGTA